MVVVADRPHEGHPSLERAAPQGARGRDGGIPALATVVLLETTARDRLSGSRETDPRDDQVDVQRPEHDQALHLAARLIRL